MCHVLGIMLANGDILLKRGEKKRLSLQEFRTEKDAGEKNRK